MKDGWGRFGAGCLGAIIGLFASVVLTKEDADDRLADKISERTQRTIQFHFDRWRRDIQEESRPNG